ncbi:MAG: LytTR family DNA-binding domain-containing protein [bacterium]
MRVVIADDEPLARERCASLLATHADVQVVAICTSGVETVAAIRRERPDVALLDIRMPDGDGFEVIDALDELERPIVVFTTAYDAFALRAFEVNAVDYLLKPLNPSRFDEAFARVRRRRLGERDGPREGLERLLEEFRRARAAPERLIARRGAAVTVVAVERIDWIEADGNYARLHSEGAVHLIRESLSGLSARLDSHRFLRIHRSAIVNLERIRSIEPLFHGEFQLELNTGAKLTVSRTYAATVRGALR